MKHLPHDIEPYTDKYFLRSKRILEAENYNPHVELKVFCRDSLNLAPELCVELKKLFAELPRSVEARVRSPSIYSPGEPLAIYGGPARDLIAYETTLLGVLSSILTRHSREATTPNPDEFRRKVSLARTIYGGEGIPMVYFGARHYSWRLDKRLAAAALDAGCMQTSTFIGSSNIYEDGVGTTPHILTVLLAHRVGTDKATVETARAFNEHIPGDVPRTILVDTFNREIDDALDSLEYLRGEGVKNIGVRIDTHGGNIAQGGRKELDSDPGYVAGKGVTVEAVKSLRLAMVDAGFTEARVFVSSGMGNLDKARAFVWGNQEFKKEHGTLLFHGVGAGNFSESVQCTADPFIVNGSPLAKTGREVDPLDLDRYGFWSVD